DLPTFSAPSKADLTSIGYVPAGRQKSPLPAGACPREHIARHVRTRDPSRAGDGRGRGLARRSLLGERRIALAPAWGGIVNVRGMTGTSAGALVSLLLIAGACGDD